MKRFAFVLPLLLLVSLAHAAQSGADILRRAMDLRAEIKDYIADVVVTVDLPDVQIPRRTAKVYYKRPDKVAIDSRGIVLIPKEALTMSSLGTELSQDADVKVLGVKQVNGAPQYTLRATQKGNPRSGDYLLIYVRGDRWTVERMEMRSTRGLEMAVSWTYQRLLNKYWMPQKLTATMAHPGERGTITVQFNNVRVNAGIPDSKFKEKRK